MRFSLIITFFICLFSLNLIGQITTAKLNFNSQKPISPYIFGYNQDHEIQTATERWTIRRLGGNRLTGFNWENGASNSGDDNNYSNDNRVLSLVGVPATNQEIPGEAYKVFHQSNLNGAVKSIITVPIMGFVAADKNGPNTTASNSDRWHDLIYKKNAPFSLTPNTTDGVVYLDESINFLVQTFGNANTNNGVKYVSLDNEPALWDNTHNLVHPTPIGAAAYVQKVIDAAKAVKAIDPNIKIIAGEFAGINIYDFGNAPDWNTEGVGYDWFISYFLHKMKQASDAAGYNLIDILSFHFYPAHKVGTDGNFSSTGVIVKETNSTEAYVRSARMSFSRSLWDDTYIEPSWLTNAKLNGKANKILTRVQNSINTYYPSVKMMIGEYDYGHDDDISHGISMADFLGVMAAKNVEIATRWDLAPSPPNNTNSTNSKTANNYTGSAFRLFTNVNGSNAAYGNVAIGSNFNNADKSSVWASIDGDDGDLHLILLNKDITNSRNFAVNLNQTAYNYTVSNVYGFDATNTAITSRTHNAVLNNGQLSITLPNLSAYHVVLKRNNVSIALKAYLEGAYNNGILRTDLSATMPLTETFSGKTNFSHKNGGGNETTTRAIITNNNIVDWVFIELTSTTTPSVSYTQSALLKADGTIVDKNGISSLTFPNVSAGNYIISIKHQNHLRCRTTDAIPLSIGHNIVDFTTPSVNCTARKLISTGVYALYSGDVNQDGVINATDRSLIWNIRNSVGYNQNDCNLNGTVDSMDRSNSWNNRNMSSGF
jgi:hypothetical protein